MMAWKCNTCGMPNFDDDVCKLCGAPKPENPEEFVEETETPTAETTSQEAVVAPLEEVEPAEVPAEEPAAEPEPAAVPTEEPAKEPESVEAPAEEPAEEAEPIEEPETVEEPTEEVAPVAAPVEKPVAPVAENPPKNKKSKKGAVIAVICVIILAFLGAAAAYMHVKNDTGEATAGEAISSVSPSPEATPSIEPIIEEEPSAIPSADPLDEIVDETVSEKPVEAPATSSQTQKTEGKTPAKVTTKPTAKPTAVATPKPTTVPAPVVQETWNDAYKKYVSNDFGFYCAYPKDFSVVETGNANDALLTLTSPDKTANMIIQGLKNWENLSVEEALDRYIGLFDGKVYYRDHGNTWYAASVVVGDRVYYRKAFVRGGNIYCFSFEYNKKDQAIYRPYIEYIEDHFKRN